MAGIRSEEQALHEIIALIPSRSNDISILDILHAFDSYIEKHRMSMEDPFAFQLYEMIIHASRRATQNRDLRTLLTNTPNVESLRKSSLGKPQTKEGKDKYQKKFESIPPTTTTTTKAATPRTTASQAAKPKQKYKKELRIEFSEADDSFDSDDNSKNNNKNMGKTDRTTLASPATAFVTTPASQQQYPHQFGKYAQLSYNSRNSPSQQAPINPFSSDNNFKQVEEAYAPPRYTLRKLSVSPTNLNNSTRENNLLNRGIPNYLTGSGQQRTLGGSQSSPHSLNGLLGSDDARQRKMSSLSVASRGSANSTQRVRFHTLNPDEYVNLSSPLASMNNNAAAASVGAFRTSPNFRIPRVLSPNEQYAHPNAQERQRFPSEDSKQHKQSKSTSYYDGQQQQYALQGTSEAFAQQRRQNEEELLRYETDDVPDSSEDYLLMTVQSQIADGLQVNTERYQLTIQTLNI